MPTANSWEEKTLGGVKVSWAQFREDYEEKKNLRWEEEEHAGEEKAAVAMS